MTRDALAAVDLAVVGGGPAGLSAAITAAEYGCRVALIDDNDRLGGQLIKQTHKFFGEKSHYCGIRGIDIAALLADRTAGLPVEVRVRSSVVGLYPNRVLGIAEPDRFVRLRYRALVIAAGAAENTLPFANCDLPGVYGAGAVQTLMNVYGIRPGRRVLMVGSGNIGIIVSYQLLQAGVKVAAVVEALPRVGGYHVHAAKLIRLGVPVLTSHTILRAHGRDRVTGATICRVNRGFRPVRGSERRLRLDTICIAVGLTPLSELLQQAGCRMVYLPELGGHIAWHDEEMQTSIERIFVAGDVAGIEEASTAMLEGRIAGARAAIALRGESAEARKVIARAQAELCAIREGPFSSRVVCGRNRLAECREAAG